jgi:hypothetical protein
VTVTTGAGTPTVRLETGAVDRTAAYVSGSGSSTLVFRYTVQAGDTSEDLNHAATTALELNGGGLADAAGNAATLTLPAVTAGAVGALATNAAWVVDTTMPTVVIGAPSLVKTDTGPATFTVTYADEHATTVTLTAADVTLIATGNALGQVAVTGTGLTRTVTISGTTGDGDMSISLAAGTARDEAGNLAPAVGPSATFLVENILPARIATQPVAVAAIQGSTAMLTSASVTSSSRATRAASRHRLCHPAPPTLRRCAAAPSALGTRRPLRAPPGCEGARHGPGISASPPAAAASPTPARAAAASSSPQPGRSRRCFSWWAA